MKEKQYKKIEKYEKLVNAWIEAVRQNPDLTIAEFLEGRVEDSEKEKTLEAICDYITYCYLFAIRVSKGMVRITETTLPFTSRPK